MTNGQKPSRTGHRDSSPSCLVVAVVYNLPICVSQVHIIMVQHDVCMTVGCEIESAHGLGMMLHNPPHANPVEAAPGVSLLTASAGAPNVNRYCNGTT